jgi:hypothetical protein
MKTGLALGSLAVVLAVASPAAADHSVIKNPGDHPDYRVELEPHAALGWGHLYRGNGFGLGLRLGIVIVQNGFIKSINNSVAISFGADWIRYGGCYYYDNRNRYEYGCGASYFTFPVTMQWNFWLSTHWSVFGEPGLYVYHGVYDDYCTGRNDRDCRYPTRGGVDLAIFVGGRYHFTETIALTMRIGYPTTSVGVSFLF